MPVTLQPSELGFRRPFNHEVTRSLRLANSGKTDIAFKVKTTAPKNYCVRPNSGRIEAGHEVEVSVLLQAMKEDPPPDSRCRDKFLVQSIDITPEREIGDVPAIWQNIEKTAKDQIEEKKIRVVFLPAEDITPNHKQVNGLGGDPPAYESSTPSYGSPAQQAATPLTKPETNESRSIPRNIAEAKNVINTSASSAANTVSSSVPTTVEELQNQLSQAKDKIKALTSQNQDQGLRQRKGETAGLDSSERSATRHDGLAAQQQPADGVPVQMVAALCLLSFLLAYFFF